MISYKTLTMQSAFEEAAQDTAVWNKEECAALTMTGTISTWQGRFRKAGKNGTEQKGISVPRGQE